MALGTTGAILLGSVIMGGTQIGISAHQASQAKKRAAQAGAASQAALAEAKKDLDINFYDQLGISKEPYELEREAMLSESAGLVEAGQEAGVRGVAATTGRVLAAQQKAQADITKRQVKEQQDLERLKTAEDARLRDAEAQINLAGATGAAAAQADALGQSAYHQGQMVQGIGNTMGNMMQAYTMSQLYPAGNPTAGGAGAPRTGAVDTTGMEFVPDTNAPMGSEGADGSFRMASVGGGENALDAAMGQTGNQLNTTTRISQEHIGPNDWAAMEVVERNVDGGDGNKYIRFTDAQGNMYEVLQDAYTLKQLEEMQPLKANLPSGYAISFPEVAVVK